MVFSMASADPDEVANNGQLSDGTSEELLTPRTPFGRRSASTGAAAFAFAGLAAVLLFAGHSHSAISQSTLHGIMMKDEMKDTEVEIIIRDFKRSDVPGGHADMMPSHDEVERGLQKGLVKDELGADGKPVFVGKTVDEGVTKGLTTKKNFDMWYNDVEGVNKKVVQKIQMTLDTEKHELRYENHKMFPVDGKGWKDTENCTHGCDNHNYYFTIEMKKNITYHGGERFTFKGDDDLWVFINNKLVVDLGGMHEELSGKVELDSLGLEKEKDYPFAMFFAERHPTESNFMVETSIRFDELVGVERSPTNGESQCCLLYTSFFSIVCTTPEDKSWYHFMCN